MTLLLLHIQQVNIPLSLSLQGAGQEKLGIYIKSVVKGGAADMVGTNPKKTATMMEIYEEEHTQ